MKVAIEALSALGGSGIERYVRSVIRVIAQKETTDTFSVLAGRRRAKEYQSFVGTNNHMTLNECLWRPATLGPTLIDAVEWVNGRRIGAEMRKHDLTHLTGDVRPIPLRAPFVQTVHDLFPMDPELVQPSPFTEAFRVVMSERINKASAIITPSQFTADTIREMFPSVTAPITVTPLASDDTFRPEPLTDNTKVSLGLSDKPYLLHVGRLDKRKNVERIVEAYTRMPDYQKERVQLLLVGAAGGSKHYEQQFAAEIAAKRVVIVPHVTQQQLVELLSNAVALVFASLAEGFGLPVIEAMQCGCPVITSTTTSLPEVAGDAALLVHPYDVDDISHAMQKLVTDKELGDSLRERGLTRSAEFSWKNTASATLDVYRQVVGG